MDFLTGTDNMTFKRNVETSKIDSLKDELEKCAVRFYRHKWKRTEFLKYAVKM